MLVLGIDLGTTSVKATIIEGNHGSILQSARRSHGAGVCSSQGSSGSEQDSIVVKATLEEILRDDIDDNLLSKVSKVAVTGQMHGVILWNGIPDLSCSSEIDSSNLITWQDLRCSQDFLKTLPPSPSGCPLATGYGCASIFWLHKHQEEELRKYTRAGTIMDFFVSAFCGIDFPMICSHNARSWGYYSMVTGDWEMDILKGSEFPVHLLPKVVDPDTIVGKFKSSWLGIPNNTAVQVGLADFQCTLYSSIGVDKGLAVLNIGTSSQLAVIRRRDEENFTGLKHHYPAVEISPFFDEHVTLFAASLTGGNVLDEFVEMIHSWMVDLGIEHLSKTRIYSRIEQCALASEEGTTLQIKPLLYGERHLPDFKGLVQGITKSTLGLGQVTRALYHGIIRNIADMMPPFLLKNENVKGLVLTGNAILQSPVMQRIAGEIFELKIEGLNNRDAAFGAALRAMHASEDPS